MIFHRFFHKNLFFSYCITKCFIHFLFHVLSHSWIYSHCFHNTISIMQRQRILYSYPVMKHHSPVSHGKTQPVVYKLCLPKRISSSALKRGISKLNALIHLHYYLMLLLFCLTAQLPLTGV